MQVVSVWHTAAACCQRQVLGGAGQQDYREWFTRPDRRVGFAVILSQVDADCMIVSCTCSQTTGLCTRCIRQVKIMKDFDPYGKRGPKTPLPDVVKVIEPKVRC
jgi:hypothetical protein